MTNQIKTIGIVGGGQLGKMMILEAKYLGFRIITLDPSEDCPSSSISDELIVASFSDKLAYEKLARMCDVITYEFEHIDAEILSELERKGHKIYPSVASLKVIQDKLTQKQALEKAGIPVPKFVGTSGVEEIFEYYDRHNKPFFLKSRCGGYDGKGNYHVKTREDIEIGFKQLAHPLMVEELADFEKEVSVIATRGINGDIVVFPIAENVHENSILDTTTVPAIVSKKMQPKIMDIAKRVMECFSGVGTFCVELFYNEKTGVVSVNEVAPRVHNSGHYTIEATRTSQFENHIRAICGLPLGSTEMIVPATIMKNVIGSNSGKAEFTGIEEAYEIDGVNAHIYGKSETKKGRKMGHYTVTGNSIEAVRNKLKKINIECVGK
ncbi:MAG: 5-(carboxyamino)imidazole ribonucleotide synthase [Firmicutes bacterium]|nr:5-(carboxyamino)imidazole ribonucleotide synthase [Bacillota bacterium]MCL2256056.1 5-(carboxyamino)imidazole ribonucleotide synthase [Bacillota bacterium]